MVIVVESLTASHGPGIIRRQGHCGGAGRFMPPLAYKPRQGCGIQTNCRPAPHRTGAAPPMEPGVVAGLSPRRSDPGPLNWAAGIINHRITGRHRERADHQSSASPCNARRNLCGGGVAASGAASGKRCRPHSMSMAPRDEPASVSRDFANRLIQTGIGYGGRANCQYGRRRGGCRRAESAADYDLILIAIVGCRGN